VRSKQITYEDPSFEEDLNIYTPEKKGKKKTIEQEFQKLSQYEHILKRPDTYIGSIESSDQ
jgi:DNA topoisomerase-2